MNCPNCGSEVSEGAKFCPNCGSSLAEGPEESAEPLVRHCRKCGAELPEGAEYCTICGEPVRAVRGVQLAGWGERFVAWLIDMVILGVIFGPWVPLPGYMWGPEFLRWIPFVDFGTRNVIHFVYWLFMEGVYGQSIGKMVMKIRVTQLNGQPTDVVHAAIESLGKAFVLPIDCIVGWVLYSAKNQRLFNYISETIVVRSRRP